MEFQFELDAKGLMCPEPVMLHGKVKDMASGQVLKVLATDPLQHEILLNFAVF